MQVSASSSNSTNSNDDIDKSRQIKKQRNEYELVPTPHLRQSHSHLDAKLPTPNRFVSGVPFSNIISEDAGVYIEVLTPTPEVDNSDRTSRAFARAGPRGMLFFNPTTVVAAIVTCGGLCPGLNAVIREVTKSGFELYGIKRMIGFQGGYGGIYQRPIHELTLENTEGIQNLGGTILTSARGGFDAGKILAKLDELEVTQLYVVGGDGTMRGARDLSHAAAKLLKRPLSIIGIPKTIDNDVDIIDRSFGFQTAVDESLRAVRAAKVEAQGSIHGVGIVNVMGRHAGFIATHVTFASGEVDLCLIPEVPLIADGSSQDVLDHVVRVVQKKGHAVVVVGEGAGENILGARTDLDAGGNRKLAPIGPWVKNAITERLMKNGLGDQVRYIDPSYMVRSVAANSVDSFLCTMMSQSAVHAAMSGFTSVCVGIVNGRTVLIPIDLIVETSPRSIDPRGRTYERVVSLTNQPFDFLICPVKPKKIHDDAGPSFGVGLV